MNNFGVSLIHQGWQEFIRANPGLRSCAFETTDKPDGDIDFKVRLGGLTHHHIFSFNDLNRHARLRHFLAELVHVSKQRGGGDAGVLPEDPKVLAAPGRRKLILAE